MIKRFNLTIYGKTKTYEFGEEKVYSLYWMEKNDEAWIVPILWLHFRTYIKFTK